MKTVLITGGSGMIGKRLSDLLIEKGYKVIWLSRERFKNAKIPRYRWDYRKNEIDIEALEQADIIVHLAGYSLGEDSWTRHKKQVIVESRVQTSKLLLDTCKSINKTLEAFISASAVGYYGMVTDDKIYTESDKPARNDFLSRTCKKWESAAFRFDEELSVRTVAIRTAFVISGQSDAFKKMTLPVRIGLGAPLGRGSQYFNWIHLDDICGIYIKAIEDVNMRGVYNAASLEYSTNAEFMKKMAKAMNRPFFMPKIPSFLIRLIMGESSGMVLEGSRISSQKIVDEGFEFSFPTSDQAIKDSISNL